MSVPTASHHVPSTSERVPHQTDPEINERITRETEANVGAYSADRRLIDLRLQELEREWDIERMLEANAATIFLIGITLARFVNRRWYLLPAAVATFLLQHALQGWCPPVGLFRRLGVRTLREIDEERYALKAMRGDFVAGGAGSPSAREVLQTVRR